MDIQQKTIAALNAIKNAQAKSYMHVGANDLVFEVCNGSLAEHGYPPLPEDYEALLRHACGIMGPYFTLFSTGGMEMAGGGLQPGQLEESESFNRWNDDDEPKALVVGKMSGGVVIIHKDGQYHVVDESARDVFRSYPAIADFIIDTVTRLDLARSSDAG